MHPTKITALLFFLCLTTKGNAQLTVNAEMSSLGHGYHQTDLVHQCG